jgi:hypothetical protein
VSRVVMCDFVYLRVLVISGLWVQWTDDRSDAWEGWRQTAGGEGLRLEGVGSQQATSIICLI